MGNKESLVLYQRVLKNDCERTLRAKIVLTLILRGFSNPVQQTHGSV